MKREEVKFHASLTSALDGGEWTASLPYLFTSGRMPSIHLTGGGVGCRASLALRL